MLCVLIVLAVLLSCTAEVAHASGHSVLYESEKRAAELLARAVSSGDIETYDMIAQQNRHHFPLIGHVGPSSRASDNPWRSHQDFAVIEIWTPRLILHGRLPEQRIR